MANRNRENCRRYLISQKSGSHYNIHLFQSSRKERNSRFVYLRQEMDTEPFLWSGFCAKTSSRSRRWTWELCTG